MKMFYPGDRIVSSMTGATAEVVEVSSSWGYRVRWTGSQVGMDWLPYDKAAQWWSLDQGQRVVPSIVGPQVGMRVRRTHGDNKGRIGRITKIGTRRVDGYYVEYDDTGARSWCATEWFHQDFEIIGNTGEERQMASETSGFSGTNSGRPQVFTATVVKRDKDGNVAEVLHTTPAFIAANEGVARTQVLIESTKAGIITAPEGIDVLLVRVGA